MGVIADYDALYYYLEQEDYGEDTFDSAMENMSGLEEWDTLSIAQYYKKMKEINDQLHDNEDEEEY